MKIRYDCRYYQPQIVWYLHSKLDPEIREALAKHINNCEVCKELYKKMVNEMLQESYLEPEETPLDPMKKFENLELRMQ